ncbi:MAG: MATE family efflux transporter [Sphaerochaetaceae bacterium]|nr:MATE family efflux transporter [Sphaerochaetaceae bacterium]
MKNSINNFITEGPIAKALLSFFFPILFGSFFQQLYNTADAIIVGRYLGKGALAAVGGSTAVIINLLINFFIGLSSGASVIIAQRYGSGNTERTDKAVHTSLALALACGTVITMFGFLLSKNMLSLIGTPVEIMDISNTYLKIYFAGSMTLVLYNMGCGIFRALGDSRHPLYFLITGSIVNIFLDFLFIGYFNMGVVGAALATVISQAVSMLFTLIYLLRLNYGFKINWKKIGFDIKELGDIIRIGVPVGIQSALFNITNLLIQSGVNSLGTDAVAAWAAYSKIDAFFWMIDNAFGISITTFVGQNYGAGNRERIRKGMWECTLLALIVTVLIELLYLTFGSNLVALFTDDINVIEIGVTIIKIVVPFYMVFLPIEILSGVIKGCGKVFTSTVLTLTGICVLRFLWMFTGARIWPGIISIMLCYPITWTVTAILFIVYYFKGHWMIEGVSSR